MPMKSRHLPGTRLAWCLLGFAGVSPSPHEEASGMKKALGITLAALFALPLAASAEEAIGKVKTVDRAGQSFVLEDGTRLAVDDGWLNIIREGDKVQAVYTTVDGRKVVNEIQRRTLIDQTETTNFGGAPTP
jgi:hypothetical protein